MSIIIRDSRADPQLMLAAQKEYVTSVFLAEGYVLLRAFSLCEELGLDCVEFEEDVELVIDVVTDTTLDISWFGQLIEDLKQALLSHPYCKLSFVRKDGNKIAHELAKLAFSTIIESVWMEEGSSVVLPHIVVNKSCIH